MHKMDARTWVQRFFFNIGIHRSYILELWQATKARVHAGGVEENQRRDALGPGLRRTHGDGGVAKSAQRTCTLAQDLWGCRGSDKNSKGSNRGDDHRSRSTTMSLQTTMTAKLQDSVELSCANLTSSVLPGVYPVYCVRVLEQTTTLLDESTVPIAAPTRNSFKRLPAETPQSPNARDPEPQPPTAKPTVASTGCIVSLFCHYILLVTLCYIHSPDKQNHL